MKARQSNEWKRKSRILPTSLFEVSGLLLHEYIHADEISQGEDGPDCQSNGGNPGGNPDLSDSNPCDCWHAYVYARQLRMLYLYVCRLNEVNGDEDEENDRSRALHPDDAYGSYHRTWMRYRKSCANQGLEPEPHDDTHPMNWMFHPATRETMNGIPGELMID